MTDQELKQLIASNARAIEAAADERAQMRQAIINLEQIASRLTDLQEGVVKMLDKLDDDRPTVLRKLNVLENKMDLLLERLESSEGQTS